MIESSAKIKVRFSETDAMGVVYHANYLKWFEVARLELVGSLGLSYKELSQAKIHLPVIEAKLKYAQPAVFDDELKVFARIATRPSVKIIINYEVKRGDTTLCTGETVHVFVNEKNLPMKPPAHFFNIMKEAFDKNSNV
ncbi:MAG: thioesterase family protein [Opitutales bacterium]